MKRCGGSHGCGEVKPLGEFGISPYGTPRTYCRECVNAYQRGRMSDPVIRGARNARTRERRLNPVQRDNDRAAARKWQRANRADVWSTTIQRLYGLTVEDVAWMLHRQAWACALCSDALRMDKHTHVDHCHATGVVRGLLCQSCNLKLGWCERLPGGVNSLVIYLNKECT